MSNDLQRASEFFKSFRDAGAGTGAVGFLSEDVMFVASTRSVKGQQAVLKEITGSDKGLIYRTVWDQPEMQDGFVCITGRAPEGEGKLGYIVRVKLTDGKITLIQQQVLRDSRMAGFVRQLDAPTPIKLPAELKVLLKSARNDNPVIVSCVDESGQPSISFRGSVYAFSDNQLAMWIRNPEGEFLNCITKNPKVAFMYRNGREATFQCQGRARIVDEKAERDAVYNGTCEAEQNHDFVRVGAGVIVDLDLVKGYIGGVEAGRTYLNQQRV